MGERINVGTPAIAIASAFAAGGQAFAASLARSAARDRADRALARVEDRAYRETRTAIDQRDVLAMLGL